MTTKASDLAALPPLDRWARIQTIIAGRNLAGMDVDAVFLMADMENGIAEGLYDDTLLATNSLFNRHQGNGVVGQPNSDGVWNGQIYYAGTNDPNLRCYDSFEDSVDDFVQLMQDSLYAPALAAAQAQDLPGFIAAVAAVPYSTQSGYAAALTARARALGLA